MMKWLKDSALAVEKAQKMKPESLEGKFVIGILADVEKPIYTHEYREIREKAGESLRESRQ